MAFPGRKTTASYCNSKRLDFFLVFFHGNYDNGLVAATPAVAFDIGIYGYMQVP